MANFHFQNEGGRCGLSAVVDPIFVYFILFLMLVFFRNKEYRVVCVGDNLQFVTMQLYFTFHLRIYKNGVSKVIGLVVRRLEKIYLYGLLYVVFLFASQNEEKK